MKDMNINGGEIKMMDHENKGTQEKYKIKIVSIDIGSIGV